MNTKTISILFTAAFVGLTLVFTACGTETEDPKPEPAKTLNKALLVGKKWYNQGSTTVHDIRANGVYSVSGTWSWKNLNSDTMIVDLDGTGSVHPSIEWKFFWSAEHEMACRKVGTGTSEILYKDQAW